MNNNIHNLSPLRLIKHCLGRSMIELMGVLAIIAVLSIGGLAGYTMVQNRYRANETVYDVMLRATNIMIKWDEHQVAEKDFIFTFDDMGVNSEKNSVGYQVKAYSEDPDASSGYIFRIEISNVPSEVCRRINHMKLTAVDEITPDEANCGSTMVEKMIFYFDGDFGTTQKRNETHCIGEDCTETGNCSGSNCCTGTDCDLNGDCSGPNCSSGEGCTLGGECTSANCCVGFGCNDDGNCLGEDCCIGEGCKPMDEPSQSCDSDETFLTSGCCSNDKVCQTSNGDVCCSDNEICVSNECVEETPCLKAGGTPVLSGSKTFCKSLSNMDWETAKNCCLTNKMAMPEMEELCPNWTGTTSQGKCPEMAGSGSGYVWTTNENTASEGYAFIVSLRTGTINSGAKTNKEWGFCR